MTLFNLSLLLVIVFQIQTRVGAILQKLHFESGALFRVHVLLVCLDKVHEADALAVEFDGLLKLLILETSITLLFLGGSL